MLTKKYEKRIFECNYTLDYIDVHLIQTFISMYPLVEKILNLSSLNIASHTLIIFVTIVSDFICKQAIQKTLFCLQRSQKK